MSENKEDKRIFLTPTGAMIALICFFLPWIKISCGRIVRSFSGPEIGGIFWLVFLSALAIFVAFFYFRSQKKVEKSRAIVKLASIAAFITIFIRYACLAWTQRSLLVKVGSPVINCTIQVGASGTIFGFLLAMVGSLFLRTERRQK